jgi:nickel/cobalt exporter
MHQALFYMVSSFWAGVVHAATPGHGKTIAAAYIVGARGRPVDAVILGVFVTLSHVSGIVLVGVLASIGSSWLVPARTEVILALSMAVLVLALGLWMLWTQRDLIALAFPRRRTLHSHDDDHTHRHPHDVLASSVGHLHQNDHGHTHDHDNVPGHGHAHEHDDAHGRAGDHRHAQDGSHTHDHGHTHEHDDAHALDTEGVVWHSHGWGTRHAHRLDLVTGQRPKLAVLMTLSIAGGILPDPAALAILLAALSTGRVVLGLVTVLVFSLGFAAALVVVGVVAAQVGRRVLGWLDSMWALRLQLATTLLIIGMGCWLTARAIGQFAPAMSL